MIGIPNVEVKLTHTVRDLSTNKWNRDGEDAK